LKEEIVVRLKGEEILRILRILTDKDEKEALAFLKDCFEEKIEEALKPPCGPETAQALKARLKAKGKAKSD